MHSLVYIQAVFPISAQEMAEGCEPHEVHVNYRNLANGTTMVQHPDQKGGIKGLADRVSSFSRRNPRRIAQAVLIIGGTLGLVLTFTLMKPSASDSVLILREKNGKIDANEAGKANKTYQTAQKRDVDKGLAISFFTSILLVGLIEPLALFIEYVATNSERKRFVQFFGRNSIEGDGMTAIFLRAEPKKMIPIGSRALASLLKPKVLRYKE